MCQASSSLWGALDQLEHYSWNAEDHLTPFLCTGGAGNFPVVSQGKGTGPHKLSSEEWSAVIYLGIFFNFVKIPLSKCVIGTFMLIIKTI